MGQVCCLRRNNNVKSIYRYKSLMQHIIENDKEGDKNYIMDVLEKNNIDKNNFTNDIIKIISKSLYDDIAKSYSYDDLSDRKVVQDSLEKIRETLRFSKPEPLIF